MCETHPKIAILSDFDGTIAEDLSDILYRTFAECGMKYARMWAEGEIGTPEEIIKTFATVHASQEEMKTALRAARFDDSFRPFVAFCLQKGWEVAIVSDGLVWAIQTVLDFHHIPAVEIYANHIFFTGEGYTFEFPWFRPETPHAGVSKPAVLQRYRQAGYRIIFIGDGRSDKDVIGLTDVLFAKDELLALCRQAGVQAEPFERFVDVQQTLQKQLWMTS
ncbi:MAG: MtnX-like HAD-IB family phosphatase [Anaerolineaceae bacterium]|jgi:2,3-diketo-5-methylthio-1-phosphopentane phosphatase|nr:MtnX-like HAD-IB family phosphatase [Anaerolineaceae bacterium]